jgi:hypothetical protein
MIDRYSPARTSIAAPWAAGTTTSRTARSATGIPAQVIPREPLERAGRLLAGLAVELQVDPRELAHVRDMQKSR